MKSRIKVLTLAVSDLETSLAFYRDGLGLSTEGIVGQQFEDGAVVFFGMNDSLILALYPENSLSKDAESSGDADASRRRVDPAMSSTRGKRSTPS